MGRQAHHRLIVVVRITENDWIKPLVMVRELAAEHGLSLGDAEEQSLARQIVEAFTDALQGEIEVRVNALAAAAEIS